LITAIIQARMGSTRLPGKVMMCVNNRPLLDYMIERVNRCQAVDQVIIATTGSQRDTPIVDWCQEAQVGYYRGSEEDVLSRYYHCAVQYQASIVVRMTSDCPLIDPHVVDCVVENYLERPEIEFVSNTVPLPCLYPDGMDVEVFGIELLKKAYHEATLPSEREHVTFYMWKTEKFRTFRLDPQQDLSQYRFTIDYPEDFEVIQAIFEHLYPSNLEFSMDDLIHFMELNPKLKTLQQNIVRNAGWESSFERDRQILNENCERL